VYRPAENKAHLKGVSVETDSAPHPAVIDGNNESIWRFHTSMAVSTPVILLSARAGEESRNRAVIAAGGHQRPAQTRFP
jgi:hypothetical protein